MIPSDYIGYSVTWRPLRLLTLYRLTLAGVLLLGYLVLPEDSPLGSTSPRLYALVTILYIGFALVAGFVTRLYQHHFRRQVTLQTLADITALSLLIYASRGLGSGLETLLFIAVIAGSLLVPGRLSLFLAACATLAAFAIVAAHSRTALQLGDLTPAGLLGLALFAGAAIAYGVGRYIRTTETVARRRAREIEGLTQLNELVIDRLPAGVVVTDTAGRIRMINRAARELLPGDRTTGDRLDAALPGLDLGVVSGEPQTLNVEGAELVLRVLPIAQGEGTDRLLLIEDAHALALEAQQIKLAALGRLTASIAHEIRNPLAAIDHAGQLLGENDTLAGEDRRLTEIIHHQTRRVNDIIETVLTLARRERAHPAEIRLEPWLRQTLDEVAQHRGRPPGTVSIEVRPPDLQVRFDAGHLRQVIGNLVGNALQYGAADGMARVWVEARRNPITGRTTLEVSDNGPGIAPEHVRRMFEPFFTTDARGTGLGLYIARELCYGNSARLTYHAREGGGSTFQIEFTDQATESAPGRLTA